ncbi:MAG TPA: glutamate--tRNA ligase, partial [Hyphomonas atlantica]|nr:glutamate--tRNA ligase [Hyphomonas atlantica]
VAEFDFGKIGRAPARFDEAELLSLNAAILHGLPFEAVKDRLAAVDPRAADETFWSVVRENCSLLPEVAGWVETVFGDVTSLVDAEDKDFIATAAKLLPEGELTGDSWSAWANAVKAETGRKGRGLFMPLRKALTGQEHGPDMSALLPLIGRERAMARLQS